MLKAPTKVPPNAARVEIQASLMAAHLGWWWRAGQGAATGGVAPRTGRDAATLRRQPAAGVPGGRYISIAAHRAL
ncbi:hypothetical protein Rmf_52280 [Roseomonas fluvialis]|uniref:Uncharacterized protein n=1 Tax=Roseomonas fluvialis TaxID=1750527 RepID=A0ABN6P8Q1_9PROT|nr:hypothetical protein Rmf_52280 [Roseomonas fluvialis]